MVIMASNRDKAPARILKVLTRDPDGETRRRDRDSRRRENKDRQREKERDTPDKPVQGPIVLLKRPESKINYSASNDSAVCSKETVAANDSPSNKALSAQLPTLILQRTSKKEPDNGDQASVDKFKGTSSLLATELLKPAYQFPGDQAMTLIDSKLKMCSWRVFDYDIRSYTGNMDYLIVTAIGRPNAGKSSILSFLGDNANAFGTRNIFPPRSREEEIHSSIYISSNQVVLIELSSVFNQAATSELIPFVSQQGMLEVSNVTWNLRLARWAMSVSHLILIVSENVFEPNVFQLMNSAEIIHTMDSALGEGSYPEPVYICNKASLELLDNSKISDQFQKSFTSVTGRTPRIGTNYHILPHLKHEVEHYRFDDFKRSVLEFNCCNRAPFAEDKDGLAKLVQKVNIQEWFQNASRLWDEIMMPSYFASYVKLLP